MREEWRKVPGIPWYYEISNEGRMRSLARIDARGWRIKTRILHPKDAQGYLTREDGELQWFCVAALVLLAFVGPAPEGCRLARHLDDNRENNRPENLAWGTDQDNNNDARRNGRSFASYGRLGKPHSEHAKKLISSRLKGKPTGHKMTPEHKAAIWAGYRKRFPEKGGPNSG